MKKRNLWKSLIAVTVTLALVLTMLCGLFTNVRAESSGEIRSQINGLEEEKADIQARIAALEQQKLDNLTQIEDAVAQKNNIDQQIELIIQEIQNTNDQISEYNVLIAETQEELVAAETRLAELREKNKERLRAMEEEGELSFWSVLFKAKSFAELLDWLNMIEEIAAADQRRLQELNEAAEAVAQAKQELQNSKSELETAKAELDASQADLETKRAESDQLLADLISRGAEFQTLLEQGEEEVEALLLEIAQQEQKYNEAKQNETEQGMSASDAPETTQTKDTGSENDSEQENEDESEDTSSSDSGWIIPCSYVYVSSTFRPNRYHPILGYVRAHNGIDLAAYQGTPVYATRSGTVTTATRGSEAGNYVVINHGDGISSVYMHLYYYIVPVGKYVSAGECIGYVGTTGLSEGPHLHFGISYNGTYVNPSNYIDF